MKIALTKTKEVMTTVSNGELEIEQKDDSWHVTYHNKIYKGSPFKLPMSFSTTFTADQVINSNEVQIFLSRF